MDKWDRKYRDGTLHDRHLFSYREKRYGGVNAYIYAYFENGKRITKEFIAVPGMKISEVSEGKEKTMAAVKKELE